MLKLLTVTQTFLIPGRGLLLAPGFSSPKEGRFLPDWPYLPVGAPNQGMVEIRVPDGTSFRAPFRIIGETIHYTSVEAMEKNPHWPIRIALQDVEKAAVPPGSEVWLDLPDRA
jgi:hypothetical protein